MLGNALIEADKNWYKGGYLKLLSKIEKAKARHRAIQEVVRIIPKEKQEIIYCIELENRVQINCEKINRIFQAHKDYQPIIDNILHNFSYFLENFSEIESWLLSGEFYKRYKKEKHPYPSLINPKTADYKNISAQLAWEMNLPLPENYDFIYLYSHGAGGLHCSYFVKLVGLRIVRDFAMLPKSVIVDIYKSFYKALSENLEINYFIDFSDSKVYNEDANSANRVKFFSMLDQTKPFLYHVRDPLSLVRHLVVKHGRWHRSVMIKKQSFTLQDSFDDVFVERDKSHINQKVWIGFFPTLFVVRGHKELLEMYPINQIQILDTQDLHKADIEEKMVGFLQKAKCKIPKESYHSTLSGNAFKGEAYLWLPLKLSIEVADEQKIEVNFIRKIFANQQDLVSLASKIDSYKRDDVYDICIKRDEMKILMEDNQCYLKVLDYLEDFVGKIESLLDYIEQKLIIIDDVMDHLRNNTKDAMLLKQILEEETMFVKRYRPDIVESWKYYQEFLKICEEKGI